MATKRRSNTIVLGRPSSRRRTYRFLVEILRVDKLNLWAQGLVHAATTETASAMLKRAYPDWVCIEVIEVAP